MKKTTTLLTTFLVIIATLVTIGFVFIYSASSIYALEAYGNASFFVKKQFLGLVLGLFALMCMVLIPLDLIKRYAPLLFGLSLILTAATLIPGIGATINGSRRWLLLAGFTFQPSELLKMTFIIMLAYFIDKKRFSLRSFTYGYLPFLALTSLPVLVLLKQPDFGQAVTTGTTALILFFIAQGSFRQLASTAILGLMGAGALIYLKAYRLRRVLIFLNPWQDPQGAGFQIIQSLIAVGSGGFWGLGITHSKQKFFYLPMQHTDFIFSVIAEETGFLGVSLLITLYLLLLIYGVRLARRINDDFAALTILGFVFLTSLQAIINMFVATGLAPTKGIGLPFISYGSSSLLCFLFMVGVIINCVLERQNEAA